MALFRRAVTLRTMAGAQAVAEALNREVKPGTMMQLDFGGGDSRQFRGEVRPNSFRIVRRVQFRNSFAPIIEGQVGEIAGGSELKMSLFVPTSLLLFVIIWTVLTAAAAMMVVQQMMLDQELEQVLTVAMATIPLVGMAVSWLGFSLEANNSERVIKGLLPPFVEGRA